MPEPARVPNDIELHLFDGISGDELHDLVAGLCQARTEFKGACADGGAQYVCRDAAMSSGDDML